VTKITKIVGVVLKPGASPTDGRVWLLLHALYQLGHVKLVSDLSSYDNVTKQKLFEMCRATAVVITNKTLDEQALLCDIIISIGGDGTMLGTMRAVAATKAVKLDSFESEKPFLIGVNMGTLGFITDIELDNAMFELRMLLNDNFRREDRATLKLKSTGASRVAANDILLQRAGGRLLDFRVELNGRFAYDSRADGLLISTPTGSTAYSLAAGGPIIEPTAKVTLITPMMPQNLSSRPIIVCNSTKIKVTMTGTERAKIYIDGNEPADHRPEDILEYTIMAGPTVSFAYIATWPDIERDFTKALRSKLGWNHNT
jgi:NAD+ kinase